MSAFSRIFFLGLIGLELARSPVAAQSPVERKGFWIGGGLGYGSASLTCSGCSSSRDDGATGYLALGGTVNPHFLLGGETDVWVKSQNGGTVTLGTITFTGYWYPSLTNGFFLKGGLGFGAYQTEVGNTTVDHEGLGLMAGLGIDIPISRKVGLQPNIGWNASFLGDFDGLSNVSHNTLLVSIGIISH